VIGQELGKYLIVEKLASGGMADVYKALDMQLERFVAIKIIRREYEDQELFVKRFIREAKIVAKLTHPNIVRIIDFGYEEKTPYLVMEYIPGGTLKDLLGKPMPWQKAFEMLLPIARALDYAHKYHGGVVHRDIKPANILISESGDLMITDFGTAKMLESEELAKLSQTGEGLGTPGHMAPEQCLAKKIDHRADIYSFGVMLFEMLTGQPPYQAETAMAVMLKQINDPIPSPRQYVKALPEKVERVIFKALAKNPDDRFQSMDDFYEVLTYLLKSEQAANGSILLNENDKTRKAEFDKFFQPEGTKKKRGIWLTVLIAFAILILAGILDFAANPGRIAQISNPNEKEAANIEPTPTETMLVESPTVTALGESQDSQSSNPTLMPSLTPSPTLTPTPSPTPTIIPSISFMERFDDPDGIYMTGKWFCLSGTCDARNVFLGEDVLVFKFAVTDSWGSILQTHDQWNMSDIVSLEGKLLLTEGSLGGVWIRLEGGLEHGPSCAISNWTNGIPVIGCNFNYNSDKDVEYITEFVPIEFDTWYSVRIEYDPMMPEIRYFLDDELIGQHVPKNPPGYVAINMGAYKYSTGDQFEIYVDEVILKTITRSPE